MSNRKTKFGPGSSARSHHCGFTLVELMISIAIVLLLMTGINLIFSMTSKAVGAGQALSEGARNNQSAQSVMFTDFAGCATDASPYIIIYSRAMPAFRTPGDMQSDSLFDPAAPDPAQILKINLDGDNVIGNSPGENISPGTYNDRNHRIDMISFFARGRFARQTGNPGTYVASETSTEAMVWYGHLYIPNNNGTFSGGNTLPGAGRPGGNSNPNNFFATQWVLGRQAILLNGSPQNAPKDQSNNDQDYFQTTSNVDLTPLQALPTPTPVTYAASSSDDTGGFSAIQYSRYDICDTGIDSFSKRLNTFIDTPLNQMNPNYPNIPWWPNLMGGQNSNRFVCDPSLYNPVTNTRKPITSSQFARTAPIFLSGCSQFVVEYAGDFLRQDTPNSDAASAISSDGVIDFYLPTATALNPKPARQIRWYGFPRNVYTGDDSPSGETVLGNASLPSPRDLPDVVPLRDIIVANGLTVPVAPSPWFERTIPANKANYAAPTGGLQSADEYICAWGPYDAMRPSLIRVTYTLDDPASRLGAPLTYEYVFKIK